MRWAKWAAPQQHIKSPAGLGNLCWLRVPGGRGLSLIQPPPRSTLALSCGPALQCLKFKTDQQTDLKRLERMTSIFFPLMATGDVPPGKALGRHRRRAVAGGGRVAGPGCAFA